MRRILDELNRRNVIRVGIAYVVAGWVLLQVADLVLEHIPAPSWVMQVFMLALALGFVPVLIFAWAFELTPDGLRRDRGDEPGHGLGQHTARKLDRVTIALLALVVVMFVADRWLLPPAATRADAAVPVADAGVGDPSIAVLAFDDLSPAGDQAYFAEGISEELLNVLAQIPDLKVAGRTSSFAFKDQNRDLREIGEILDVAHILEGSVRTAGNRVRVTAQLIKANDGFHLFSRTYDRELTDIFAVQDEIAGEISRALRSAILGQDPIDSVPATPVEAYDRFLRARQWIHTRDRGLMEQASVLLDEALAIDPDYAPALAQKGLVTLLLSSLPGAYGDMPAADALAASRPLLERAIELDPQLADAHATLGLWHSMANPGYSEEAVASLRRALAINPSMPNANNWLAGEVNDAASIAESARLYETVVEHDPLYAPAFNNLMFSYAQTRQLDKADALIRRVQRITGDSPSVHLARGALAVTNGDLSTAMTELGKAYEFNPSASVVLLWYGTAAYLIGEFELSAEISYETDALVPMELVGRHDEAAAIVEALRGTPLDESQIRGIGAWYLMQDRAADLVAYLERQYAGVPDWLAMLPKPEQLWGAAAHTQLAVALRRLDRGAEAERLLAIADGMLETQRAHGADNLFFWYSDAEYAALRGDRQRLARSLRNAIDTGFVSLSGCDTPAFDGMRSDARFIELEAEMIRRARDERRELGLLET